jgi:hypothetical protein
VNVKGSFRKLKDSGAAARLELVNAEMELASASEFSLASADQPA